MTKDQVIENLEKFGFENLIGLEFEGNLRPFINRYEFFFDLTNELVVERTRASIDSSEPILGNVIKFRHFPTLYTMYFKKNAHTEAVVEEERSNMGDNWTVILFPEHNSLVWFSDRRINDIIKVEEERSNMGDNGGIILVPENDSLVWFSDRRINDIIKGVLKC